MYQTLSIVFQAICSCTLNFDITATLQGGKQKCFYNITVISGLAILKLSIVRQRIPTKLTDNWTDWPCHFKITRLPKISCSFIIGVRGVFLQGGGYFPAQHFAGLLQLCRGGKCWAVK